MSGPAPVPDPVVPDPVVPDPVVPDGKDWTWVLQRACPECGADVGALAPERVAGALRAAAAPWPAVLARPGVRRRPAPGTWSPLEYGAHVRDVFTTTTTRLHLLLSQDDPLFANWDQDATALEQRYAEQDPARVAEELRAAAAGTTAVLDGVRGEQWSRRGRRSNGSEFTVATLAQYVLHDVVHHVHDVGA
ncbi:DinB family protein [Quadrisphaera sp. DSM 44207]|uniref:DinB family protein n=1 Tax=Quadrisphaera sp. DSM 44207 TaxID=1881057 RepID=UPI0008918CD6|nr:DinB family protein [Quadrisphaera sp. DSM 44207]SDQ52986.1 DinB superfamily protein [Quadrisphaera sp. DSM 44207]